MGKDLLRPFGRECNNLSIGVGAVEQWEGSDFNNGKMRWPFEKRYLNLKGKEEYEAIEGNFSWVKWNIIYCYTVLQRSMTGAWVVRIFTHCFFFLKWTLPFKEVTWLPTLTEHNMFYRQPVLCLKWILCSYISC